MNEEEEEEEENEKKERKSKLASVVTHANIYWKKIDIKVCLHQKVATIK